MKKMINAGATGRLGDVTKLIQTQRIDSQWRMQDFVNGEDIPPFPMSPQSRRSGSITITRGNCLKSAASQSPSKKKPRRRRRKKSDASTSQSNDSGVSRKRFKPSTPEMIMLSRRYVYSVGLRGDNKNRPPADLWKRAISHDHGPIARFRWRRKSKKNLISCKLLNLSRPFEYS